MYSLSVISQEIWALNSISFDLLIGLSGEKCTRYFFKQVSKFCEQYQQNGLAIFIVFYATARSWKTIYSLWIHQVSTLDVVGFENMMISLHSQFAHPL